MIGKRELNFAERLKHLVTALRALKNANNHYCQSRDRAYLLDIMVRLRALVCSGGANVNPLLLDLMSEAHVQVHLYSWPPKVTEYSEKSVYSLVFGKTWQVFEYENYSKYSFVEWLDEAFYFSEIDRRLYSRNEVLKRITNTQGGAHYDLKVPFLVNKLAKAKINNRLLEETMIEQILNDIATATFWVGSLLGGTPHEVYDKQWTDFDSARMRETHAFRVQKRINENVLEGCKRCEIKS